MKTQEIEIGKSGLYSNRLVLGCMRMASLNKEEVQSLIEGSYHLGITLFDHADIYGGGQSESLFGQAFKQTQLSRDQVLLQSKVGIRKGYFDFSKDHIMQAVEGILSRLQTDYLDFLLLHRPDALMEPEEVAHAFDLLERSGKVRYFGVSNHTSSQMTMLQSALDQPLQINQVQFGPAHTPMIDRGLHVNMLDAESFDHDGGVLDYCRLHQITPQAWSPFQIDLAQGLFMKSPQFEKLTNTLELYAHQKGVSFEAMVIAWINRHPAKFQTVVGTTRLDRLEAMVQSRQVELTRPEWYDIYLSAGRILP